MGAGSIPDPSLDLLLELHGQVFVVDWEGTYWVRFVVTRVPASLRKPQGLDYSLTLHGPDGARILGFDNAHSIGAKWRDKPHDHRHRSGVVRPYEYRSAASLLEDFWKLVDSELRERGVIP